MIARVALVLAALTVTGCAGRLSHFHNLSQAGIAYTRASRTVLQDAGTEAIDADSIILLRTRSGLTEAQRADALRTNNELLRTRLKILADIQRHSTLLESYFLAIADLVDEKNSKPAADAAKTLASSLTSASSSFKKAELGGINIASKIPTVVKFAVRRMRSKALEQELRERGEIIEREIALQEAALSAVNQMMQADRQALIKAGSTELVSGPFARATELPEAWVERRRRLLTIESRVPSADTAVKAAAKLREAFIALMERGDTEPSVATLIAQARTLASEVL